MKKMTIKLMIFMTLLPAVSLATTWADMFRLYELSILSAIPEEYRVGDIISNVELGRQSVLIRQIQYFCKNLLMPDIGLSEFTGMPIEECNEPLADVFRYEVSEDHPEFARIAMMPNPVRLFESPNHNSGTDCASRVRKSLYLKLGEMVKALDQLAKIFDYSEGQIEIRVFEGLRDLDTQAELFADKVKEIQGAHDDWAEARCEQEASKWVSPVRGNVPPHSTGAAVDIRLWDNELNEFVDMGPFGVLWGQNPTAPTFFEELTDKQKINRLMLLIAADRAGLVNYSYEWWHFSSGDRYAAWWRGERVSSYGPVDMGLARTVSFVAQ